MTKEIPRPETDRCVTEAEPLNTGDRLFENRIRCLRPQGLCQASSAALWEVARAEVCVSHETFFFIPLAE